MITILPDKIVLKDFANFNVQDTLECGQIFRYYKVSPNTYNVFSLDKFAQIVTAENVVEIHTNDVKYFYNFFALDVDYTHLEEYAAYARKVGATLCIMNPYNNRERWEVCQRIIDEHPSTTVDNRTYLLIFNNHLPRQRFCL